jgi:hypothetical protein
LKPKLLEDYRTKADLKTFRDDGVALEHDFYDESGSLIGTIEISPNDLR